MPSYISQLYDLHCRFPLVKLIELDVRNIGGTNVYRFTPMFAEVGHVNFNTRQYNSIPVSSEGHGEGTSGTHTRPTMSLSNVHKLMMNEVVSLGDLAGANVRIIETFSNFLDGEVNANPNQHSGVQHFIVNRMMAQTNREIVWELTTPLERMGMKVPRRQMLADETEFNLYTPGMKR